MDELAIDPGEVAERLQAFIAESVEAFRRDGAIVGLSGGIDSAVVATLAARALGPNRVLGLILPELDSAPESKRLARHLAGRLGIRSRTIALTSLLGLMGVYGRLPLWMLGLRRARANAVRRIHGQFRRQFGDGETPFSAVMVGTRGVAGPWVDRAVAYHRVKVRLRMVHLYYHAELSNLLVVGTDNKTELGVGFFVKHGDSAADVAPLAGLYKTQVRALAAHLGVPREIIERAPSPDVLPGLTDEDALDVDYATLDRILWRLDRGEAADAVAAELAIAPERVRYVEMLARRSEHLRAGAATVPEA